MNEYFEKKRLQYLAKRDAKSYYSLCVHMDKVPEDRFLWKRGLEEIIKIRNKNKNVVTN